MIVLRGVIDVDAYWFGARTRGLGCQDSLARVSGGC